MGRTRVAIFVAMLSVASALAQQQSGEEKSTPAGLEEGGTLCVLPNSPDPPTRISPGGEYNPATLTMRIDKGQPLPWPHKQPVRIENLALRGRHLVVLTSDGKRIQSFWFQFSDYRAVKLCLYFDGYQGVQLGNGKNALWCKCK